MKFVWAYEIIYVYLINSNVVFPSVKMMFITLYTNKLLKDISNVTYLTN